MALQAAMSRGDREQSKAAVGCQEGSGRRQRRVREAEKKGIQVAYRKKQWQRMPASRLAGASSGVRRALTGHVTHSFQLSDRK